ncbi:hypothetical protein MML48_9g00011696 [Holotrichia oblita]|uniref:Uncharacterized protein n=1 Tax=Holotrichia oblita TaxID=644536 RepID=A0ACB9SQ78_HOLOL|nr:hypothetical protein MML48_9g00011696 [Holotrichia oblita]
MPKVKDKTKYTKRYDENLLQKALADIGNGLPKKQAAKKYGIPRPTLQYRVSSKFKKNRHGPNTYLTEDEETNLEQWIIESCRKGFPRNKSDIQTSVKSFLDASPRRTPFKDNTPGKNWYRAFSKRHSDLVSRTSEAVTKASSAVSESDIRKWFSQIENYLKEKSYFSILEYPDRIYNGDETCFMLCPKEDTVIAPRGTKNVYKVDQGAAKANLTVMFTISASGVITPPMEIYPYKRLSATIVNSVPDNWGIGTSDNGWMKSELFIEYISNVLHPYLKQKGVQLPIILFVDGHKTHMTACDLQLWNVDNIHFSKCLGKDSKKENLVPEAVKEDTLIKKLTYEEVVDIMGPTKVDEIKRYIKNHIEHEENIEVLMKIFVNLKPDDIQSTVTEDAELGNDDDHNQEDICNRKKNIINARKSAHDALEEQAKRMKVSSDSSHQTLTLDQLSSAKGYRRRILPFGYERGVIAKFYSRSEFSTCPTNIVTIDEVPKEKEVPLRSVATAQSTGHGQGFKKCSCKTKCQSKKCA